MGKKSNRLNNTKVLLALHILGLVYACSSHDRSSNLSRRTNRPPQEGDANNNPPSPDPNDNHGDDHSQSPSPTPTPTPLPLTDIPAPFGLRSFNRVNASMASLTGVSTAPNNILSQAKKDALATALPGGNRIIEFQGSTQFATYKLAGEYCHIMVDNEVVKPNVLAGINLNSSPQVVFNAAGKTALVKAFTSKFWVLPPTNLAQVEGMLGDLITELMDGKNLNSSNRGTQKNQTTAIAKAICTATLASAPVTFY